MIIKIIISIIIQGKDLTRDPEKVLLECFLLSLKLEPRGVAVALYVVVLLSYVCCYCYRLVY